MIMPKTIEKMFNYIANPICPGCNKAKMTKKVENESSTFWTFINAYQFSSHSNRSPLRLCKGCYEEFSENAILYQAVINQRQQDEQEEAEIQNIIASKKKREVLESCLQPIIELEVRGQ